ncbi:MAG: hypothetical protein K9L17_14115 [Clostridiales bacterium]|nr:hypothetical protein [Clostridiales bacterium]MCF8023805.1 hypothetical protein [Clostridiales bacterium]
MNGYEKLKLAVEKDCNDHNHCGCFNPNGCDVPGQRKDDKKCFHPYCDKFKWIIDRAKHYGEKLGLNWEDILNSWELNRDYWYMNYYQEANQPKIESDYVRVFETVKGMLNNIGEQKFRCPKCNGISTNPYACNSGIIKDGKVCDWKVGGLFGDLGKGIFVYCKDKLQGEKIFMPVAWE